MSAYGCGETTLNQVNYRTDMEAPPLRPPRLFRWRLLVSFHLNFWVQLNSFVVSQEICTEDKTVALYLTKRHVPNIDSALMCMYVWRLVSHPPLMRARAHTHTRTHTTRADRRKLALYKYRLRFRFVVRERSKMDGKKKRWHRERESARGVVRRERVGWFLWLGQQKGELRTGESDI